MKRRTNCVIAAITALVVVTGLWSWWHFRSTALTTADLRLYLRSPGPPQRFTEGCSEVKQAQALSSLSPGSNQERPSKRTTRLSADEIAVYRAVIKRWVGHERESLNVSSTTFPLDASSSESGLSDCACLQGVLLEDLSNPFHSFRDLTSDVLPGKSMRLVDAKRQAGIVHANDPGTAIGEGKSVKNAVNDALATGLFSMSEIAFNADHQLAVVSYAFWCGSLCGSGATLVFEKIGGEWRKTDRECGGWVS
jgi:hypothetical protein